MKSKMAKPAKSPKPSAPARAQPAKKASGKKVGLVKGDVASQMMDLLRKRYPDAHCELNYSNEYELLISVILSAQTTDVMVNKVTPHLFKRFPTPAALADAPPETVKELIRPTGYYNAKAQNIQIGRAHV